MRCGLHTSQQTRSPTTSTQVRKRMDAGAGTQDAGTQDAGTHARVRRRRMHESRAVHDVYAIPSSVHTLQVQGIKQEEKNNASSSTF